MFLQRKLPLSSNSNIVCNFEISNICPHCGVMIDPTTSLHSCGRSVFISFMDCTNVNCKKMFFSVYIGVGKDSKNLYTVLKMLYTYPEPFQSELSEQIRNLSPRCVDLYSQAASAERLGHLDLAACGYRNAIEALVKDYAIKYKDIKADEKLMRKRLQECIADYLDGIDEAVSAYMIKEFGNSATHYPLLGHPFDFQEQREYLEIFMRFMTDKIRIQEVAKRLPAKHTDKFK